MRPTTSSLLTRRVPRSLSQRCPFSTTPARPLWNGATQPYKNHPIPLAGVQQGKSVGENTVPSTLTSTPASQDAETVRRIHQKYIEDLLSRAASSSNGLDTPKPVKGRRARTHAHSLSEPQLFRTDGPLTPYPIELDTGEKLEPKHATLVRVMDKNGEQRRIVVAEVDDESGKQRSILLALDLMDLKEEGPTVGRRITAEEMYATLGLEAQGKA